MNKKKDNVYNTLLVHKQKKKDHKHQDNLKDTQIPKNSNRNQNIHMKMNLYFPIPTNNIYRKEKEVSSKEKNVKSNARNIKSSLNAKRI